MVSYQIFYQKESDPLNIKSNLNIIFDTINDIDFADADKKSIVKICQIKSEQAPQDKQEVDMSAHAVKCDGKIEEYGYVIQWLV